MGMTQEDKELLLKDLCARLPYRVKIHKALYGATTLNERDIESFRKGFDDILIPYLRPMSSMTEEETKEYHKILITSQDCSFENSESATTMVNDWLLSKHFDVRGLILKGLAIEVTEENNLYKE